MKSILLVDDQAHVLRVIKLSLDRNGFEVDTALGGQIALSMLHENSYDVVITAEEMPAMNGKQLCEAIERDFKDKTPLVFVLGDDNDISEPHWVTSLSMTELVAKPLSLRWLITRLNEYFGHFDQVRAG